MVDPIILGSSLNISGSNRVIAFEKYITTDVQPTKIIISNSSTVFGVQLFHTGSANKRIIITSGSVPVTSANPVTLYPNSGSYATSSSVELLFDVNINELNTAPEERTEEGNQLVEDIYFNLVPLELKTVTNRIPLPGFPANARLFEVNTISGEWSNATKRNLDGLGFGGIELNPSSPSRIRFTNTTLLQKIEKLQKFKSLLKDRRLGSYFNNYFKADSDRAKRAAGFKIILYAILWENQFPRLNLDDLAVIPFNNDVVPRVFLNWGLPKDSKEIETWIQHGRLVEFDSDAKTNEGASISYIDNYLFLIDDILAARQGIATEIVGTEAITDYAPTPEDAINIKVGTLDVDVVKTTFSLSTAIESASRALINSKTLQFFNEEREYKTVLNFGLDDQYLIEAWRPLTADSSSVQLKLTTPLSDVLGIESEAHIVREFAKPVIDTINIDLPPFVDNTPYLRPPNMEVGKFSANKQSISNVTLRSLGLETGSYGQVTGSSISYEDRTFNRWYTSDFNSSELNIDFTDYSNFVTFGSAELRLEAFKQKLLKIQQLNTSASLSSSNEAEKLQAIEVEYIKRNFDPYEQFLYFDTEITPYSASAYYVNGEIEYNLTGSWPKNSSGKPKPISQVNDWYLTQVNIAKRYDEFNPNYLVKQLPQHIQEDTDSSEFLRFISMFGHVMDNLKVYIDQFPYIYSTNPDPFEDLSMDQTYEVAKSFGISLPNAYSLESLQSFVETVYGEETSRTLVAETWKRFLHSYPLFTKTKGSKSSLELLLNAYGINTPSIQIKESAYPTDDDYVKSDEYSYTLQFVSSSANRISIPFVSSSISASSLQIRFKPSLRKTTTLLSGDSEWAVDLVPHPSSSLTFNKIVYASGSQIEISQENRALEYGRLQIVSGSQRVLLATSSYFPLYSTDDYTHIMLRSESQDMMIVQTDGDQILFQEKTNVSFGNLWNNTELVHVGGSGSIRIDTYDGIVDEIHGWTININDAEFLKQAYDPGSYYGATYTSSYASLYVHLGFSNPLPSITQSAANESPYVSASSIATIRAVGFLTSSYERILRSIKQYVPTVGAVAYSDTKVHVAPPPTFNEKFIYDDGSYILSRTKSIKSVEEKKYTGGLDTVWFAVSPTEFVNQTIMRSMGIIDVNYLIGSPRKLKKERYVELDELLNFYIEHYNQDIDANQYIRFYKNLLKAPTEYARTNIPARANLLDGIVIESPILERKRIDVQKAFRVDGANTVTFEKFVSGSGSANVGAYQFDVKYDTFLENDYTRITNPVLQYANDRTKDSNTLVTSSVLSSNSSFATITSTIDITDTTVAVSSTPSASVVPHRRFLQNVSTNNNPSSSVQSSLTDNGSGIAYVTSVIESDIGAQVTQSGYSRNPYLGLTGRVNTELNTRTPYYAIEPTSNFNDVGTTTYFYNTSGIYWFTSRLVSKNVKIAGSIDGKHNYNSKRLYRAKLDISGEVESAVSDLYANITLLDPRFQADYPGRDKTIILPRTYGSGSSELGVIKVANIFSLFAVQGVAGLRVRLYKTQDSQATDFTRVFDDAPTTTVLFDAILTGADNLVFPYTLIQTDNSTIFFTINNTTATTISSNVVLNYFKYQPSELVPRGYLPRHYKFNRYEGIAQRRRNHLGCKIIYCPEGCPDDVLNRRTFIGKTKAVVTENIETDSPVIIYPSRRTSVVVNTTRGSGGGTGAPPPTVGDQSPVDRVLGTGGKGKLDDKKK